ncbi:16S rRNA (guanine(966)-N(2))-methyltransferase RsmD [Undibacterium sp. 14-3-2]|uniref:16S rRNA (guanine(966)-N(2))-methyltransferase RsmD n=1 Tax=Undibacterium sp. 14-3-2 TaxID=2800129 RepID=UPI0019083416|nr:16S rRNA (guanine(966)-N(2))-methyltransferase RsmD [Undibacterium sp. 14-3-2]MBK1890094.1 16S rRNA (guanine(966)-N(2))-methyltransferase RsmD [Undibacterium sp. 14-3-2]
MKTKTKKPVSPQRVAHQVRIIGGQWKRSLLSVIEADGLRPTPDRVRETTFNWLNHLFNANWAQVSCLDLFAGSGALGFEAASRGARLVTMVESHTPAFKQLEQVKAKLEAHQCQLLRGDAGKVITSAAAEGKKFDLILLDPPFGQGWLAKILPVCREALNNNGYVYVEAEFPLDEQSSEPDMLELLSGWQVIRADKAGSVYFHILQRNILQHNAHENQA